MNLQIPELCLVVLVGASGSGKSSFARKHFKPTEIVSSDFCRGVVCDDETSLEASDDAFELVHTIAHTRLRRGRLTVIDATNVRKEDRESLVAIARQHDVFSVAIVLAMAEDVCFARNQSRPDRQFGRHVLRNHCVAVRQSLRSLEREGFRFVHVLRSQEEVDAASIERTKAWSDRRDEAGPFDVIGDVHGCYDELVELLAKLGWDVDDQCRAKPASGEVRKVVFVGDLTDRGPKSVEVLKLVMSMVGAGQALCVAGNHDVKLARALEGRNVKVAHGLETTLMQLAGETPEFKREVVKFLDALISHYQFDGGKLVVAHAGMKERYVGRMSRRVREFALYGETTGEVDDEGLPVRLDWAADYRGKAAIVYGHTVIESPQWFNNTICLDTGCCFGGQLTALRWPEKTLISVPPRATYVENPRKKSVDVAMSLQQQNDLTLDIADVLGKRVIETRLLGRVTVREENAIAALEVMSRFAVDPRWLIYLPPTMSPCATSQREGYLEHPEEALTYFAAEGVESIICEEKHMGSRAVAIIGRDEAAIARRFGIEGDGAGVIYTRTGRRFFDDRVLEATLLDRVRQAIAGAGLWDELKTDWLLLDCELMPWSAKAQDLLARQYAAVGSAARATTSASVEILSRVTERQPEVAGLRDRFRSRQTASDKFVAAYRKYCWDVASIDDYRLAPFHLLASEGAVHVDQDHAWHMSTLAKLANDPLLMATPYRLVRLDDAGQREEAIAWWTSLTDRGGEGMVVKPLTFIACSPERARLVLPAVKCRGREYLRIIYGPEYDLPENLNRLRSRGLAGKRALAQREFALGIEGLERFVRRAPLREVHECTFGVLAMESEPVDPRL